MSGQPTKSSFCVTIHPLGGPEGRHQHQTTRFPQGPQWVDQKEVTSVTSVTSETEPCLTQRSQTSCPAAPESIRHRPRSSVGSFHQRPPTAAAASVRGSKRPPGHRDVFYQTASKAHSAAQQSGVKDGSSTHAPSISIRCLHTDAAVQHKHLRTFTLFFSWTEAFTDSDMAASRPRLTAHSQTPPVSEVLRQLG